MAVLSFQLLRPQTSETFLNPSLISTLPIKSIINLCQLFLKKKTNQISWIQSRLTNSFFTTWSKPPTSLTWIITLTFNWFSYFYTWPPQTTVNTAAWKILLKHYSDSITLLASLPPVHPLSLSSSYTWTEPLDVSVISGALLAQDALPSTYMASSPTSGLYSKVTFVGSLWQLFKLKHQSIFPPLSLVFVL